MSEIKYPDRDTLSKTYEQYAEVRLLFTKELESRIEKIVRDIPSHPTVKARIKDFASYFRKYFRLLKNDAGSADITDLIGVRIVCPFMEDISVVENLIKENFEVLETERKGSNYSFKEFGYESLHLLIKIPDFMIEEWGDPHCTAAEIQIRTILQDAWAEVEHELVYKAAFTPFDEPMKRKLAAVNASLSLADTIFQEVRTYQRQLNGELGKRRNSFFKKIEESTDALLFEGEKPGESRPEAPHHVPPSGSIDDLLLNALYAHNKNQFSEAIEFYSRILEMDPSPATKALIYKHRGMAHFARSHYGEAIADFANALELDPHSYKAAYYRGVVHSVLQQYAQAIDDFSEALAINPYQPFCFYRRGQAYYHIEDFPQALADCEAALSLEALEPARKFRSLLLDKLKM